MAFSGHPLLRSRGAPALALVHSGLSEAASGIIIKPRARIFHGHEWVYGEEVQKMFGDPQPGDVITLKDFKDRGLGSAIFNPKSQIIARRFPGAARTLPNANCLGFCRNGGIGLAADLPPALMNPPLQGSLPEN